MLPPPQAGEVGIRLYLVDYLLRKQGRTGEKWEYIFFKDIGLMYLPTIYRVIFPRTLYTEPDLAEGFRLCALQERDDSVVVLCTDC